MNIDVNINISIYGVRGPSRPQTPSQQPVVVSALHSLHIFAGSPSVAGIEGSGLRIVVSRLMIGDSGLRLGGLSLGCRVWGLRFGVRGSGFEI